MTRLARAEVVLDGNTAMFDAAMASAARRMEEVGKTMAHIGSQLTMKISLPVAAVGVAATHMAADFDAAMRKISAHTATSEAQVNEWRKSIRDVAIQYGQTGTDAAQAMFFITSAGLTGAKAMDTLHQVLKGTATGLGDAATLAHAATSAMNAYSKSGMTAGRALEILAGGIKSSNFHVEELAPNLGRVTGMSSALGISLEDVIGTLAVFGHVGTDASEATTQLSGVLSTLLEHNQEAVKSLARHGLSLSQLRREAAGPGGLISVMRTLFTTFGENSDELRVIIPNIRAFRGVLSALAQDGQFVDKILRDTRESTGLLDAAFQKSMGPAFEMKRAWAQIKDALVNVGQVLIPTLVPAFKLFAETIHDLSKWFQDLSPNVRNTMLAFIGLAAIVGPFLLVLGTVIKIMSFSSLGTGIGNLLLMTVSWGKVAKAFADFRFMLGLGAAMEAAKVAGTGLSGVLVGVAGGLRALAIAAAPFMLWTTGITLLGLVVVKWIEMKLAVNEATAAMKLATQAQNNMFAETKPEEALRIIKQYNDQIAKLGQQISKAPATVSVTRNHPELGPAGMTGTEVVENPHIEELSKTRARLIELRNGLQLIVDKAREAEAAIGKMKPPPVATGPWGQSAAAVLRKLAGDLQAVDVESSKLGATFDANGKRVNAYETAIAKLTEDGAPFDAALNTSGLTLNVLTDRMAAARVASERWKQAREDINAAEERGMTILRSSRGETDTFKASVMDLGTAFFRGRMNIFEFVKGLQFLQNNADNTSDWLANAKSAVEQSIPQTERYQRTLEDLALAFQKGDIKASEFARAQNYVHAMMDEGNASLQNAKQIVEASRKPLDKYNEGMRDLSAALAVGAITADQYARAVKNLGDSYDGTLNKSKEFKSFLVNEVGSAIDMIVDGAMQGKVAFGDFVKSAIADLTKLIIKMEILHWLFPQGTGGDSRFKDILGFADGGFLPAGELGIVGERGPEMVVAGSRGMTIQPMQFTTGSGGGQHVTNITVPVNVSAIDSRGVAQFFNESQDLVAAAVLKATQRSHALSRRLSGR